MRGLEKNTRVALIGRNGRHFTGRILEQALLRLRRQAGRAVVLEKFWAKKRQVMPVFGMPGVVAYLTFLAWLLAHLLAKAGKSASRLSKSAPIVVTT